MTEQRGTLTRSVVSCGGVAPVLIATENYDRHWMLIVCTQSPTQIDTIPDYPPDEGIFIMQFERFVLSQELHGPLVSSPWWGRNTGQKVVIYEGFGGEPGWLDRKLLDLRRIYDAAIATERMKNAPIDSKVKYANRTPAIYRQRRHIVDPLARAKSQTFRPDIHGSANE